MNKYFITMLTENESDSDIYYVNEDYSIQKIKNNKAAEVFDKETLEDAIQELRDILAIKRVNCLCNREKPDIKQIEALKIAISTIDDILKLYNNN